jgi:hypothetical protein
VAYLASNNSRSMGHHNNLIYHTIINYNNKV